MSTTDTELDHPANGDHVTIQDKVHDVSGISEGQQHSNPDNLLDGPLTKSTEVPIVSDLVNTQTNELNVVLEFRPSSGAILSHEDDNTNGNCNGHEHLHIFTPSDSTAHPVLNEQSASFVEDTLSPVNEDTHANDVEEKVTQSNTESGNVAENVKDKGFVGSNGVDETAEINLETPILPEIEAKADIVATELEVAVSQDDEPLVTESAPGDTVETAVYPQADLTSTSLPNADAIEIAETSIAISSQDLVLPSGAEPVSSHEPTAVDKAPGAEPETTTVPMNEISITTAISPPVEPAAIDEVPSEESTSAAEEIVEPVSIAEPSVPETSTLEANESVEIDEATIASAEPTTDVAVPDVEDLTITEASSAEELTESESVISAFGTDEMSASSVVLEDSVPVESVDDIPEGDLSGGELKPTEPLANLTVESTEESGEAQASTALEAVVDEAEAPASEETAIDSTTVIEDLATVIDEQPAFDGSSPVEVTDTIQDVTTGVAQAESSVETSADLGDVDDLATGVEQLPAEIFATAEASEAIAIDDPVEAQTSSLAEISAKSEEPEAREPSLPEVESGSTEADASDAIEQIPSTVLPEAISEPIIIDESSDVSVLIEDPPVETEAKPDVPESLDSPALAEGPTEDANGQEAAPSVEPSTDGTETLIATEDVEPTILERADTSEVVLDNSTADLEAKEPALELDVTTEATSAEDEVVKPAEIDQSLEPQVFIEDDVEPETPTPSEPSVALEELAEESVEVEVSNPSLENTGDEVEPTSEASSEVVEAVVSVPINEEAEVVSVSDTNLVENSSVSDAITESSTSADVHSEEPALDEDAVPTAEAPSEDVSTVVDVPLPTSQDIAERDDTPATETALDIDITSATGEESLTEPQTDHSLPTVDDSSTVLIDEESSVETEERPAEANPISETMTIDTEVSSISSPTESENPEVQVIAGEIIAVESDEVAIETSEVGAEEEIEEQPAIEVPVTTKANEAHIEVNANETFDAPAPEPSSTTQDLAAEDGPVFEVPVVLSNTDTMKCEQDTSITDEMVPMIAEDVKEAEHQLLPVSTEPTSIVDDIDIPASVDAPAEELITQEAEGAVTDVPAVDLVATNEGQSPAEADLNEEPRQAVEVQETDLTTEAVAEVQLLAVSPSSSPEASSVETVTEDDHIVTTHEVSTQSHENGQDDLIIPVAEIATNLLVIEPEVERPKSPWTPSFQVVAIGGGVSPSDADDQHEYQEDAAESEKDQPETNNTLDVEITAPVTDDVEEGSHSHDVLAPEVRLDISSLDASDEPARPWTPSYSVHSQGSPLHTSMDLDEEKPVERPWTPSYSTHSQGSPLPTHTDLVEDQALPVKDDLQDQEDVVEAEVMAGIEEAQSTSGEDTATIATSQEQPLESQDSSSGIVAEPSLLPPEDSLQAELDAGIVVSDIPEYQDAGIASMAQPVMNEELLEATSTPESTLQIPHLVVDTIEVENVLADVTEESSRLSPHHQDEQSSGSWVPSYSVSTQGSPSQERSNPLPKILPSDEVTTSIVESSVELETTTVEEVAVDSQPPSIIEDSGDADQDFLVNTEEQKLEDSHKSLLSSSEMSNNESTPIIVLVDDGETLLVDDGKNYAQDSSNPTDDVSQREGSEQEPLKSPWTPSYSVTVQGPGLDTEELDKFEPLPQSVIAAVSLDGTVVQDKTSIVEEGKQNIPVAYTTTSVGQTEASVAEVTIASNGGSDSKTLGETIAAKALHTTFPTAEEATEYTQKVPELSVSVVDETPSSTTSTNISSPTHARKRLESTTSSRFFPGGWFSPRSEGRASLEVAQGEFTPVKPTPSIDDVPDSLSEPDDSASEESHEEPDESSTKKGRWCVVM